MQEPSTENGPAPRAPAITPEQRVDALRHVNRRRGFGLAFLWEWTKIFWISVALFLVLRTFIVEAFRGSQKADATTTVQLQILKLKAPVVAPPTAVNGNKSLVQLSWTVAANSLPPSGYRIYWQNGTRRVLIRTLSASATSATIAGLPVGSKFQVEAFRGSQVADSPWVHV